jgi:hypothetical protein
MSAQIISVDFSVRPDGLTDLDKASLKRRGFTREDIDRAERFGRTVVALYRLMEVPNGVMTPDGQGTLHRATSEEALVVLTRGKATNSYKGGKMWKPMERYNPEEVRPA